MRITHFKIENFRNLRLAECTDPPDFMVICGGNGCGKSALLQALMTAKEHAGSYGNFTFDPRAVSADADFALISMTLAFTDAERAFVKRQFGHDCPDRDTIIIRINRGGKAQAQQRSNVVHQLLGYYSQAYLDAPGFFDYIDAYRRAPRIELSNWDASFLSDDRAKQTLSASGEQKFQNTKQYLAGLVMRDLQQLQAAQRAGRTESFDSLAPIRKFFDRFFAPMRFIDVRIDLSPFRFIVQTPRGEIDIDDMSSGEKEVLNVFVRFHQLKPKGAVILFDEADAHLHPDLERRYLDALREASRGNQLWLTTHSPEMMIAAGTDSLYAVLKEPPPGGNQFVRVTQTAELHGALAEVMGSRGLVSFNQRIVFIEGEEASADREVYERLYPPGVHNVSFVPAGNSATVRKTAERVNELLSSSIEFQHYFCIVDGDIDRPLPAPAAGDRLFHLPVYHVENFLLDDNMIQQVTKEMLASKCPYGTPADVEAALKQAALADTHVKPFARALLDARVARVAKEAWDAVFQRKAFAPSVPSFAVTEGEARVLIEAALRDGTWRDKCKGRDVLRGYTAALGLNYEHFRNSLIAKLTAPPSRLAEIMDKILDRR